MISICLLPTALPELFAQTTSTGRLTLADRYGIMATITSASSTQEDLHLVDRLLYGLRRGRIQIVDDLSSVLVKQF
ncbi:hypothetical protein JOY44_18820 [Phormidium sp. CLA17]|uniref:hypothetical protein n=1 Tax=Leptolyngbya sp. Cla-17 TaxID=2803751 RepID=UPI001490ADA5|nr:hypothetical protein [Leptolyngbya sp. Cla-17]MBM0743643.1 hypothetical protein [Leptolyngbya sp. Cla-17]